MKLIKFTQVVRSREEYPVYINPDNVSRVRILTRHEKLSAAPEATTYLVMGSASIHLSESLEEVIAALTSPTLATRLAAKL